MVVVRRQEAHYLCSSGSRGVWRGPWRPSWGMAPYSDKSDRALRTMLSCCYLLKCFLIYNSVCFGLHPRVQPCIINFRYDYIFLNYSYIFIVVHLYILSYNPEYMLSSERRPNENNDTCLKLEKNRKRFISTLVLSVTENNDRRM